MTKDELIQKWLSDNLNHQELEAFKALDDYDALMKLSKGLNQFKASEFDEQLAYNNISKAISKKSTVNLKTSWLKSVLRIAALLAISFSVYYFTNLDSNISTLTAEKKAIELPDHSLVTLNAESKIAYNKKQWKDNRTLTLDGEAYFKVEKGSQFKVQTQYGTVTVLGTQFLVENRKDIFEVVCYEGSVKVTTEYTNTILKPGDQFLILDGKLIAKEKEETTEPSWLQNKSIFKSMPYKFVLNEFERQYQVTIEAKNIDTSILFTGHFVHNNKDMALRAITLPLNISYTSKNDMIVLHEK